MVIGYKSFLPTLCKLSHSLVQLVRDPTDERRNEIIRYYEVSGVTIANSHTDIIEDGGTKVIDPEQLKFKEMVDPYGLMNPGKSKVLKFNIHK